MYETTWRRSPPRNDNARLIAHMIRSRPGITTDEFVREGFWLHEAVASCQQLVATGDVERRGHQFFPRSRKRKVTSEPTFWQKLAGLFR